MKEGSQYKKLKTSRKKTFIYFFRFLKSVEKHSHVEYYGGIYEACI